MSGLVALHASRLAIAATSSSSSAFCLARLPSRSFHTAFRLNFADAAKSSKSNAPSENLQPATSPSSSSAIAPSDKSRAVVSQPAPPPAPATPPPATPPQPSTTLKKAQGGVRTKFSWFLAGVAIAGAGGYYRLHEDVWSAAGAVEHVVSSVGPEVHALQLTVNERLAALEKRVNALEKAGTAQPAPAPAATTAAKPASGTSPAPGRLAE